MCLPVCTRGANPADHVDDFVLAALFSIRPCFLRSTNELQRRSIISMKKNIPREKTNSRETERKIITLGLPRGNNIEAFGCGDQCSKRRLSEQPTCLLVMLYLYQVGARRHRSCFYFFKFECTRPGVRTFCLAPRYL